MRNIAIEQEQMPCKSSSKTLCNYRICLDFTVYCFYVILFSLFEALFGIFTFFDLARIVLTSAWKLACMLRECSLFSLGINRPLFALCMKQFKMSQIENSFVPINRQSSQPTPNREPSSLLEWPRCEGGKLEVNRRFHTASALRISKLLGW